ncbi:MAG: hypothetical protein H6738_13250 [Alphaproteobacteria bacterium]|nr:hypothetical protein [Alphaproteobacteria bacterium]MCB9697743.1 hypothetical protein [Alphaproteobacteria bacterium]
MHRDQVRIDEPCHARWAEMSGDERRRFCASCQLHVHDLSAMTEPQARELLRTEPDVCVRYTTDGRGRILHRAVAAAGALLAAAPALASNAPTEEAQSGLFERVYEAMSDWWYGEEPPAAEEERGCQSLHPTPVDTGLAPPPPPPDPEHEVRHVTMGRPAVTHGPVVAGPSEVESVARIEVDGVIVTNFEVRCSEGMRERFSTVADGSTVLKLGAGTCNVLAKGGPPFPAVPIAAGDDLVCTVEDARLACVPRR